MDRISESVEATALPKSQSDVSPPQSAGASALGAADAALGIKAHVGNVRWTICALLFFAATINYLDRQVIATLKDTLQQAHVWDENGYAWVVFAFQTAYAVGLLIAGRVMDWLGTRKGFSLSVLIWSLAAMGHALVSTVGGFAVRALRAGFGGSRQLPGMHQDSSGMVSEERARAGDRNLQRRNKRRSPGRGRHCSVADANVRLALDLRRYRPHGIRLADSLAGVVSAT
jgi:hypothetical protein